jgi:hypothetical protein
MSPPLPLPIAEQPPRSLAIVNAQALVFGELRRLDIGIQDGVIVELAPSLSNQYARAVDARGLIALPGLIDTAAQADVAGASEAAARGGITTLFAITSSPTPWTAVLTQLEGRCHVDFAVYASAQRGQAEALRILEGQLGFAGPWLGDGGAQTLGLSDRQALLRQGRLRVAGQIGPGQTLLSLLDSAMEAMRPLHVLPVRTAQEIDLLMHHPSRRLTSAAVAASDLLHGAPDGEPDRLLQALRDGTASLLTSGSELNLAPPGNFSALTALLPLLLDLLARSQITLAELGQWTAQKPAQAFQLQGKGGLLPGLDGDVVLVDLQRQTLADLWLPGENGPLHSQRTLQGAVITTICRGQPVWDGGKTSLAPAGGPVQLARPLAILPR